MASIRTEREELRLELQDTRADVGELTGTLLEALKLRGDKEGRAEARMLAAQIQDALAHFGRYLDRQDELADLVDGRGNHTATLEKLIEKRNNLDRLIELKKA